MRKIKEVLRLKFDVGLGLRQIARSCSIGLGTAHEYLQRAEAAKITWPLGPEWDDDRLEAALFGGPLALTAYLRWGRPMSHRWMKARKGGMPGKPFWAGTAVSASEVIVAQSRSPVAWPTSIRWPSGSRTYARISRP